MSVERERRARDLFKELCDLGEPERTARLERATAGDPELRRAVAELLAEDAGAGEFLAAPALGADFRLSGPYAVTGRLGDPVGGGEQHPEAIGPYRILGVIGSGGMGIVYRAEQQRPRRIVALKVLRADIHGSRAERYFELEAEALGRLTHPGIARIHEAGTADFGRGPVPFIVMELVEGVDLREYARQNGLALRDRVALLVEVCRAVHHAHQKGVIHRDLKPGNVIVTEAGTPKVLDFGLARLVDEERSRSLGAGDTLRIVGTLAYMSPEQLTGDPGAIDAATDVYALGATAYEILCGRPSFDLVGLSLPAALHRVTNSRPEPLRSDAPYIDRDLAAVVEKAMDPAKDSRYQSADMLAEDLSHWLRDEPVLARTAGPVKQLRLFARRNRMLVGGAGAVLALIAGLLSVSWQARSASMQESRALAFKTYLLDRLTAAGDPRTDGREQPISDMLERAARDLDGAFAEDPESRAEVADTLGMVYLQNGLYAKAEKLVRESLEWRSAELGPRAPETLASRNNLGIVLVALGHHAEAEEHLRAAHEGRREVLGDDDEDTQRSANWLGQVLLQKADPSVAEKIFMDSWSVRRRTLGEDALPTLATREHLALAWRHMGRVVDAERALREILTIQRRVCGPRDFEPYETLNNLSSLLLDLGGYAECEILLEEALEGYRWLRGPDHPDTQVVRENLRVVRALLGEPSAPSAEPEGVSEEITREPRYYALLITFASLKFYQGKLVEAERDLRRAIDAFERSGGQERNLSIARQCLAGVLLERGETEAAVAIQRDVLADHREAGTELSLYALNARTTLAESLRRAGRWQAALAEVEESHARLLAEVGETALYTLSARVVLSAVLADLGRLDEALAHSEGALRIAEEPLRAPSQYTEIFRVRYGKILTLLGRYEEAERALLAARAVLIGLHTERGPYTLKASEGLAQLYEAWGRDRDAAHWASVLEASTVAPVEASAPRVQEEDG